MFAVFLLMNIFLIGYIFNLLNNEIYYMIIQAVFIIMVSLIINFLPNLNRIQQAIYQSRLRNFLIPIIAVLVVFIILVAYIFLLILPM